MKIIKEFKEFAIKGNFIDLAVGVIIGGAFGKIVSSLVNDIFMPVISLLIANVQTQDLKLVLAPAVMEGAEVIKPEIAMTYGMFLQNVIDFVIIAFCVFLFVKLINRAKRAFEKEQEALPPPAPPRQEQLLEEIRDLLKKS